MSKPIVPDIFVILDDQSVLYFDEKTSLSNDPINTDRSFSVTIT